MHVPRIDSRLLVMIMIGIGALLSFSISTQAAAISPRYEPISLLHSNALVARHDDCNDSGSYNCNITGSASDLCCPVSMECIPLENATSVICCNIDQTCDKIHPIVCPSSPKDGQKCGDKCCPLGFECDGSGKRCLMKPENLPEKYKEKQGKNETSSGRASQESQNNKDRSEPALPTGSSNCPDFPAKAIVVGLFPGIVLGAALMILWTKLLEVKTRRRSIKSFGIFTNAFPSVANLNEKRVSRKPSIPISFNQQPPIPGGFSLSQPQFEESTISPLSFSFRSPNLGPPIPPVRSRDASPAPTPPTLAATPDLAATTNTQYAVRPDSDPTVEFKPPPAPRTQNFTRLPPAVDPRQRESGMTLFSDISPVQRRNSFDTGYSASVYNDGNELGAFPFTRTETAIPPIPKPAPLFYRQAGGPMPRPPVEGWRQVGKGGRV